MSIYAQLLDFFSTVPNHHHHHAFIAQGSNKNSIGLKHKRITKETHTTQREHKK